LAISLDVCYKVPAKSGFYITVIIEKLSQSISQCWSILSEVF